MADMAFDKLIEARRSVRAYAPSEISRDELTQIVAEALNAPSWKNEEATRYHIAASAEAKARVWKEALPSFNATSSANAAALVVVSFKKGLSGYLGAAPANELGEMWGAYDAGLASSYFVLAAKNHGWADAKRTIVLARGKLPLLAEVGRAQVSLAVPAGDWTCWALETDGTRRSRVPVAF